MANKVLEAYAPYNFVPLSKEVFARYEKFEDLPHHDQFQAGCLDGTITYEIVVDTPLIVGTSSSQSGQDIHFFTHNGKCCIPSNTLKGLIRSNMVTLGRGMLDSQFIYDNKFLYRSFTSSNTRLKSDYIKRMGLKVKKSENGKTYSALENVQAGYVYKKGRDHYEIIPAKTIKGKSYFRISEQVIHQRDFSVKDMQLMYTDKDCKRVNRDYKPYYTTVTFDLNEENTKIKYVDTSKGKYKGYLLSPNAMSDRKAHYIVNERDDKCASIVIPFNELKAYEYDCEKNKKIRRGHGQTKNDYYNLPEKEGMSFAKPIFYIQYNGKLYFGFSPYLRLFYDKSIRAGISKAHENLETIDYTRALLGFTDLVSKERSKCHYRSRVQVEEAVCTYHVKEKAYTILSGEPKASCIGMYVTQDQEEFVSYNDDFSIRGIKHYWMKENIAPIASMTNEKQNKTIYPIGKGSRFKGTIHFKQLHDDEMGLLLYTLLLEKGTFQQIGLGKPYGFGRVHLENVEVKVQDLMQYYKTFNEVLEKTIDVEQSIEGYKAYMKTQGIDIEKAPEVKDLITMKTKLMSEKDKHFGYMDLRTFKGHLALPSVSEFQKNQFKYEMNPTKSTPYYMPSKNVLSSKSTHQKKATQQGKFNSKKGIDSDNPFVKFWDHNK